ncbi:MAG TPA: heme exporter protein CcmB [Gemmatimonadaceae bacterium]|nr:heme exporter protein CcmB [Gemmatimonadaceae bacterium]
MGLRAELRRVGAVAWKDLTAERRSKAGFNAVVFLGLLILLLFGFALGPDAEALRNAAAGSLWLAILFAGVLAFNRSYQLELDGGALEPLLLYPGARWSLFVGKLLANLLFVLLVEAVVVPVAVILFQVRASDGWLPQVAVLLLGTVGFVALGTFYAAMASRSRAREVLLPLLLFPMLVPVLLAAAEASSALLAGDPMREAGAWIRLLVAFDAIFLAASVAAFEHVIEV